MHHEIVIEVNPEIHSGAPVFAGTRVPVRALLGSLTAGDSLDDFLADFPGVRREQAVGFLRQAVEALLIAAKAPSSHTS